MIDPYRCARCGSHLDDPSGPRICGACLEAERQLRRRKMVVSR